MGAAIIHFDGVMLQFAAFLFQLPAPYSEQKGSTDQIIVLTVQLTASPDQVIASLNRLIASDIRKNASKVQLSASHFQ